VASALLVFGVHFSHTHALPMPHLPPVLSHLCAQMKVPRQHSAEFQMTLNVLSMDQSILKFLFYGGDSSHLKS
jgi:hypothetical protein